MVIAYLILYWYPRAFTLGFLIRELEEPIHIMYPNLLLFGGHS